MLRPMRRTAALAPPPLAVALAAPSPSALAEVPFGPGERMSDDLYWIFIKAGSVTLETPASGPLEGRPALRFRALARSAPFIDTFYKVRDELDSRVDPGVTLALPHKPLAHKEDRQEGGYARHYLIRFDANGNVAYRYSHGKLRNAVIIPPGAFDPLSMLFLSRTKSLAPGVTFAAPVTDGGKSVTGTARVVRRETIKNKAGAFDTLLVEPDARDIGGVFRKSPHASLKVWIINGARRIPVHVESRVVVGYFSMELTGCDAPQHKAEH